MKSKYQISDFESRWIKFRYLLDLESKTEAPDKAGAQKIIHGYRGTIPDVSKVGEFIFQVNLKLI